MSHEKIDDEIRWAVDDEEPMHETGVIEIEEVFIIITSILSPWQTQKPGRGKKTFTIEDELGQDKLGTVENKPENKMK